ncbi:MAG TPA: hypothetical protein H9837_02710 [Candidatus Brachybacterium merdigallinarum]|nr:hypothetical protein [Candidatus Brachybacterium merdigallinarum]
MPRRSTGAAGPKVFLGTALGSIGYGCSLLPSISLEPLLILIPAGILLVAGLHQSATEDAHTPQ